MTARTAPKATSTAKRPPARKRATAKTRTVNGVPAGLPANTPSITTKGKRELTEADRAPFLIDEQVFYLINPKEFLLSQAAASIDPSRPWTDGENFRALQRYTGFLLEYVEEQDPDEDGPHGHALLMRRLSDPKDDLDLTDITDLMIQLMDGWFSDKERPTGSPRE